MSDLMTAPTGIDLEALIELAAEQMRVDYVSQHKPNLKQWSEIDDGMRAVWRQHARAAAEIYETALAASQAEQIAGMEARNMQLGGHAADAWLYATAWMHLHDQLMGWIQERPEVFKDFWDSDPRGSLPSPERILEEKTSLAAQKRELIVQMQCSLYEILLADIQLKSAPSDICVAADHITEAARILQAAKAAYDATERKPTDG